MFLSFRLSFIYAILLQWHQQLFARKLNGIKNSEHHGESMDNRRIRERIETGEVFWQRGEYSRALKVFEAIDLSVADAGEKAEVLNNLGVLHKSFGHYVQAEKLFEQSLACREAVSKAPLNEYIHTLNNVAMVKRILGKYQEAERLYHDAVKLLADKEMTDTDEYNNLLNNVGVFYLSLGIYDNAKEYLDQSRERRLNKNGEDSFQYFESLNNRAFLATELNKPAEAGELFLKLLTSLEKKGLESHPNYDKTLKNYAEVLMDSGENQEAVKLLEQVCARQRQSGRQNTAEHVAFLDAYARALSEIEGADFKKIVEVYDEALGILRKQHLTHTLQYTKCLSGRAQTLERAGRYQAAFSNLTKALIIQNDLMGEMGFSLSEQEALQLLENIRRESGLALALLVNHFPLTRKKIKEIYQQVALRKSAVFEMTLMQHRIITRLGDEKGQTDNDELMKLLDKYRDLKAAPLKESEAGETETQTREALEKVKKELLIQLNLQEGVNLLQRVEVEKVCGKMAEDTLIMDFYHNRLTDQYLLFTLSASEDVRLFQIGPVRDIDSQIEAYRSLICESTDTDAIEKAARRLFKRFFRFLKTAKLNMPAKLILSTVGNLSKCPFETLITEKGDYLTDVTLVKYIPTVKEISGGFESSGSKTATIITDPDYDYPGTAPDDTQTENDDGDSKKTRSGGISNGYHRLHGTKTEGEKITALLKKNHWQVDSHLCGKSALDKRVKALAGSQIIHMATHGFFKRDGLKINPLHKSGLVFTGINSVLKQPERLNPQQQEEIQDATLSAYDMMNMKLKGTQLLVLSACETGLGEYVPGNGIIGLQRAAFLAGVQSMVMTLWKIPDSRTVTFMEIFYRKYLQTNEPEQALKEARDELIDRLNAEKGYADPYIWGAFVYLDSKI